MDTVALTAARACGLIAWALVSTSVLWGLTLSLRAVKQLPAKRMTELHQRIALFAIVFTVLHVLAWMINPRADFGLLETFIPFTSSMAPFAVACGIVAAYLLVAVQVSSILMRKLPRRIWARVHLAALPLFLLLDLHVFLAGADRGNTLVVWSAVVVNSWFVLLVAFRWLGRKPTRDASAPRRPSTPEEAVTRSALAAHPPDARTRVSPRAGTVGRSRPPAAPRGR